VGATEEEEWTMIGRMHYGDGYLRIDGVPVTVVDVLLAWDARDIVRRTIEERDAERKTVAYLTRRLELVGDGVSVTDIDTAHKSLWLVRRTDAAGKPGEYGRVIVWAENADDAVNEVLFGGFNGGPMYGYRDSGHTTAVPLDGATAAITGDDAVVIAETLR
jgi:hypothetical protein